MCSGDGNPSILAVLSWSSYNIGRSGKAVQQQRPSLRADNETGVWAGSGDFKTIERTAEGRLAAFGASSPFQPQSINSTTSCAQAMSWVRKPGGVRASTPNVVDLSGLVPASVEDLVVAAEPL